MVLTTTLWGVSLVQIIRLPMQGPLVMTGESGIWIAPAFASAISTILLGVWKIHRSSSRLPSATPGVRCGRRDQLR